jgi:wyosine [tRNA(Phe)-imidazoG37] synthetase (radical SAM superfamily)
MKFVADDVVKTCSRIESGLRLGPDGIRACCFSVMVSPFYWTVDEAEGLEITREMIVDKRKELFQKLNDDHSDISCKKCLKVEYKKFKDVGFENLGFIDLAHFSTCNLRCSFCGFTQADNFKNARYDALSILERFAPEVVDWDSCVDFNGGEPSLLKDLDRYLDYFKSRAIRVRLYSNGLRYRQSIFDALADGTISWLIVSLDAGTPSTYRKIKKSDKFLKVIENLTRYSVAGSQGRGMLAVKYIFSDGNCGEDDVAGFVYSMLAIRPQKIYLGFDFFPLADKYKHQLERGVYDYSEHIDAYAKTYLLLKKHGLNAVHFTESFLSVVIQNGRNLMQQVLDRIKLLEPEYKVGDPLLHLQDFRNGDEPAATEHTVFATGPLRVSAGTVEAASAWSLAGKRVMIAPATPLSVEILSDPDVGRGTMIGFLDRSGSVQGKSVSGYQVYSYKMISELAPDVILVTSVFHKNDIVNEIAKYADAKTHVLVYVG